MLTPSEMKCALYPGVTFLVKSGRVATDKRTMATLRRIPPSVQVELAKLAAIGVISYISRGSPEFRGSSSGEPLKIATLRADRVTTGGEGKGSRRADIPYRRA